MTSYDEAEITEFIVVVHGSVYHLKIVHAHPRLYSYHQRVMTGRFSILVET